MDIQASKIEAVKMILELEDSSTLEKILSFLKSEKKLPNKQKTYINQAIEEFENGEGIPHNMVMEETKKRYSKYFEK